MARESKFARLERERGKPIGQILVEELNETESIEKTAVAIGITYRHVKRIMDELGITKKIQWSLPESQHAN